MRVTLSEVATQRDSLLRLAQLAEKASLHPDIVRAAKQITQDCQPRDEECEVEAVFRAIKYGTPYVRGLENGIRYVSDALAADQFFSPTGMLTECMHGACAGDCDDQTAMVCALLAAIGYRTGLRAWGPKNSREYSHVFPVVYLPKRNPTRTVGLDTTVPKSYVGWQPPRGRAMTAVIY